MTVLIEDSPRNLLAWVQEAISSGAATGAVINPFASPALHKSHRRSAGEMADTLLNTGATVFFDPTTHALQLPRIGDFRYYDEYDLWGGQRGDLDAIANQREHVRLVFDVQDQLQVPHLAPTVLLHTPLGPGGVRSLNLAEAAVDRDAACWLSVAGDASFWAAGAALDAHIGALAQLEPAGWFLTVARATGALPAPVQRAEIAGLCRTVLALSEYAPVHISHGDLAGLPAVAAGASSVGTGWDQRQRMFSYVHYEARGPGGGVASWYDRPLMRGLLSLLKRPEAALVAQNDAPRAQRLLPGALPAGIAETFQHHARHLGEVVADVASQPWGRDRYLRMRELYELACHEWPQVARLASPQIGADEWLEEVIAGLELYARGEGW